MGLLVIKHPHFPSTIVQSMVIIESWEYHISADCDLLTCTWQVVVPQDDTTNPSIHHS
jgi:hypothetical protein